MINNSYGDQVDGDTLEILLIIPTVSWLKRLYFLDLAVLFVKIVTVAINREIYFTIVHEGLYHPFELCQPPRSRRLYLISGLKNTPIFDFITICSRFFSTHGKTQFYSGNSPSRSAPRRRARRQGRTNDTRAKSTRSVLLFTQELQQIIIIIIPPAYYKIFYRRY